MSRRAALGAASTLAVLAIAGAVVAAGTRDDAADSKVVHGGHPVRFEVHPSAGGVRLGMQVTYPRDRQLTGGGVHLGEHVEDGLVFWSRKYDGSPPDPFPVAADTRVFIEGWVLPICDRPDVPPVLTVDSREPDGSVRSDAYRPSNIDEYLAGVDTYCHLGPEVEVRASSQDVNGDFTVTLNIVNPSGDPALVASAAFRDGDTTWDAASTTVLPHGSAELVLHGHGEGCSPINPWTTGRLTVDGIAPDVDAADSEQC